jgi:hypothetical protein
MTVPNASGAIAEFGTSSITEISLSASVTVNDIKFDDGASSYTLTIGSGLLLTTSGAGVDNFSGQPQTFVIAPDGGMNFSSRAQADGGNYLVNGTVTFSNNASGSAGDFTVSPGGLMTFSGNADAGTSTITGVNASMAGAVGGVIKFQDSSNVGAAHITLQSGTNGGSGGSLYLLANSISGSSQLTILGNAFLDMSGHAATGAAIGSLSGDGTIFLGGNHLDIGFGEQGPPFTGRFADGGANGGAGGSITLAGGASLTLTNADTYTGPTIVNGATLTLEGHVTTDITLQSFFSTLQGSGTIAGNLTSNIGQVIPDADATLTVAGNYYQQSGQLTISIDGTGPAHTSRLIVNGAVTLDTAHLAINFTNDFLPHQGDTFTFMTFGSVNQAFNDVQISGVMPGFKYSIDQGISGFTLTALNDGFQYEPTSVPLANISTRLGVETGDNVLIGGFIVTNIPGQNGGGSQKVLIRGIGPSLAASGVQGVLQDPILELHDNTGAVVATNDNWKIDDSTGQSQEDVIVATTIPPTNDAESAIVTYLGTGAYTAILSGKKSSQGVGLIEVYALPLDIDSNPAQIANISTRGFVQTGDSVIIGGFIIAGDGGNANVLVRAIGPSLTSAGVANALADPILELHDGQGTLITSNDDWRIDNAEQIQETGIPPANDKEAAIYTSLAGGNYTAIVRGKNDSTGVGLIEVYRLP